MSDKKNVTENSTTSQFEEHGTDYTDEEYKFFQMTDLDVEEVKHNNHQESQVVHHAEHGPAIRVPVDWCCGVHRIEERAGAAS